MKRLKSWMRDHVFALGLALAAALLSIPAAAHAGGVDVLVGFNFGFPLPVVAAPPVVVAAPSVVVAAPPVVVAAPPPVVVAPAPVVVNAAPVVVLQAPAVRAKRVAVAAPKAKKMRGKRGHIIY